MLFNSLEFAVFLPLVFLCYWFVVNSLWMKKNFQKWLRLSGWQKQR